MKLVIDTNILLDFFIDRDTVRHEECVKLIRKINNGEVKAVILGVVIAEMVWVMKSVYGFERIQIAEAVKAVVQIRGVLIGEKYEWLKALEQFTQKKVKFIDAMIANVRQIKTKKWAVVSYDREFDKLDVYRMEPNQVI